MPWVKNSVSGRTGTGRGNPAAPTKCTWTMGETTIHTTTIPYNPPSKMVQGYKLNIFYPDLICKSTVPEYLEVYANNPDFHILRFHAVPTRTSPSRSSAESGTTRSALASTAIRQWHLTTRVPLQALPLLQVMLCSWMAAALVGGPQEPREPEEDCNVLV